MRDDEKFRRDLLNYFNEAEKNVEDYNDLYRAHDIWSNDVFFFENPRLLYNESIMVDLTYRVTVKPKPNSIAKEKGIGEMEADIEKFVNDKKDGKIQLLKDKKKEKKDS